MKKILAALAIAALSSAAWAQQRNFDAVQIKTTQVADGLYILEGEGGNIGVSAGKTLQQVIDAKPTSEFDEEWGKFRKPEVFVEIVYNGLAPRKK